MMIISVWVVGIWVALLAYGNNEPYQAGAIIIISAITTVVFMLIDHFVEPRK